MWSTIPQGGGIFPIHGCSVPKSLLPTSQCNHRKPPEILCPCPSGSEWFWLHMLSVCLQIFIVKLFYVFYVQLYLTLFYLLTCCNCTLPAGIVMHVQREAAWFRRWWRRGFAYSMLHEVLTWAKSWSTDEVLPEVKRLCVLLKVALIFQYLDLTYICSAGEKWLR